MKRRLVTLAAAAFPPLAVCLALGIALALGAARDDADELRYDLSDRDPAAFYDFNVDLLVHLGKPIKLDVKVAAKDLDRKEGWLTSSYYITPDELRGIELRVPKSSISDDGPGQLRVRGEFKLSAVMEQRQGQISLQVVPRD